MLTFLLSLVVLLPFGLNLILDLWKMLKGVQLPLKRLIRDGIIFATGCVLLLIVFKTISIWTTKLWFTDVGYVGRFWIVFFAKWKYFAMGFIPMLVFLLINVETANKLAPKEYLTEKFIRATHRIEIMASLLLSIGTGLLTGYNWKIFMLYKNQVPFGMVDPIFKKDISFYVFTYPIMNFFNFFILAAIFFAILIVMFHYLFIKKQYEDWAMRKVDPEGKEKLIKTTTFMGFSHLSALLAILMLALSWITILTKWGMLFSGGTVFGIGYTDDHYRIPAYTVFMVVLLACSILFIIGTFVKSKRMTVKMVCYGFAVCCITWLIGLIVVPGIYQHFGVTPNELAKETVYLKHNIKMTRIAYGITEKEMTEKEFPVGENVTQEVVSSNMETIEGIRLWDWRVLQATNMQKQVFRPYYTFPDVDVVRYNIDGKIHQMMFSEREMDQKKLPSQAQTWQNTRMVYTHGFGACANPVNTFTQEGLPDYWIKDIPPSARYPELEIKQPRIYFGETTDSHIYVNTKLKEFDYPSGDHNVTSSYNGPAGVKLNSFMRRLAFALEFDGLRFLTSNEITDQSRILFDRDIEKRVKNIAPFLLYDNDKYHVVVDGQLWTMWDAYTVSNYFPYSERLNVVGSGYNYIRNSVKVVINAYNGKTDFYVFDESDPIIRTYAKIFPGMFKPAPEMPEGLRAHVRYPEDLLYVQGKILTKYHMSDTTVFYNREDMWDISKEIIDINNKYPSEIQPYYIIMKMPGEEHEEFIIMLPFTPTSTDPEHPRNNMEGWLAGRCDDKNYGKLILYKFPKDKFVNGPRQIGIRMNQADAISKDFTMWNQQGSQVVLGNMLVIPVSAQHLLYVQAVYLQAQSGRMPELRRVVVSDGDRISYASTFEEALADLIGGMTSSTSATNTSFRQPTGSQEELIKQAAQHLKFYQELTAEGKFSEAGKEMEKLNIVLKTLME